MPILNASLSVEMSALAKAGRKPAVVVVDEQVKIAKVNGKPAAGTEVKKRLHAEMLVLEHARKLECQIFLVEYFPTSGYLANAPYSSTIPEIEEAVGGRKGAMRIKKRWPSAFDGTDLRRQLTACKATTIVLMGRTARQCIKDTAIGGPRRTNNDQTRAPGAVDLGLKVLTNESLIGPVPLKRDDEFFSTSGVSVYTRL